jgi:hypothetical protein
LTGASAESKLPSVAGHPYSGYWRKKAGKIGGKYEHVVFLFNENTMLS